MILNDKDLRTLLINEEMREIAKAKRNNWQIQIGQQYIRQNNIQDGEIYTFKAIPAIDEICLNHDLYEV